MKQSALLCLFAAAFAANISPLAEAATVGNPESWTNSLTEGWTNQNWGAVQVPLSVESKALKVAFPVDSFPAFYSTVITAFTNASKGHFTGDYFAGGVADISFRFFCQFQVDAESNAPVVQVLFRNDQTGRLWQHRLSGLRTNEWLDIAVPLEFASFTTESASNAWSDFFQDMRSISWMGVWIKRNSHTAAQTYRLDDFQLIGPGTDYSIWIDQYADGTGVGKQNKLPRGDLDDDGLANWDEWIAGTPADSANEQFTVRIQTTGASTATVAQLTWDSHEGRRYSVLRTTGSLAAFDVVATNLATNLFTDATATNSAPCFYRLGVQRAN